MALYKCLYYYYDYASLIRFLDKITKMLTYHTPVSPNVAKLSALKNSPFLAHPVYMILSYVSMLGDCTKSISTQFYFTTICQGDDTAMPGRLHASLCHSSIALRNVKRSSNFRTSILKFELEFDLHTFGIRISDY